MNQLISIQCLRFAAATGVVLTHSASGTFPFGGLGVDIFFVISGFIITKVMGRREAMPFVKDRFSRIFPIYWVCLIPLIIAEWDGDVLRLLASVTLWPVFGEFRLSFLGVAWTLHFELLFYAAAALVLWRKAMLPVLLTAYASALVAGVATGDPVLGFVGSPMIIEFLLGVAIALLPYTEFRRWGSISIAGGILAAAWGLDSSFGTIENMFNGGAPWRWAAWGIPAALIVWGSMQFERALRSPIFKFGAAGGDASYALYLSHPFFLLFKPSNPYLLLALGPPIMIALGFLIHYKIEKPLLTIVRRALAGQRDRRCVSVVQPALSDP